MSSIFFIFMAGLFLLNTAYATCGCVCDENNIAKSYIVELSGGTRECTLPLGPPSSQCYKIDCAKCGQVLECYVNTGDPTIDQQVCHVVDNTTLFCPAQQGNNKFKTQCGQQCSGSEGTMCYAGESWGECPAVIGSSAAKCKGGASGSSAQLSNFASYQICIGGGGSTCEASGVCSTDSSGGASYHCMISSGCIASTPVTCLSAKCDAGTFADNTCPCATNL